KQNHQFKVAYRVRICHLFSNDEDIGRRCQGVSATSRYLTCSLTNTRLSIARTVAATTVSDGRQGRAPRRSAPPCRTRGAPNSFFFRGSSPFILRSSRHLTFLPADRHRALR